MAISLNDHENRIKSFEGKLPDIEHRIDNIVATAKDYAFVSLSKTTYGNGQANYYYDQKYDGYNFKILEYSFSTDRINCSISGSTFYVKVNQQALFTVSLTWSINTNVKIISCYYGKGSAPSSVLVLFYK